MCEEIEEAKRAQDLFFQQKLEQLRVSFCCPSSLEAYFLPSNLQRGHERRLLLANKQDQAIKSLKVRLKQVRCFRINKFELHTG